MSEPSPLAKYDITNRISKYLDRHLVIPLLQFLETKQVTTLFTRHHLIFAYCLLIIICYLQQASP